MKRSLLFAGLIALLVGCQAEDIYNPQNQMFVEF